MRINGTKYEKVKQLPKGALPVSVFARKYTNWAPAYIHVKYDRFKFGYKKKNGDISFAENPGFKIVDYEGMNYVIPTK